MSLNKPTVFTGVATALITPFYNGQIDYTALGHLIQLQIDSGISAILVAGTTGEGATLSIDEYHAIVAFAKAQINGRVPLLAGCGANSTARALELVRAVCEGGADALLAVTPYYNKTNDRGIIAHYHAIADSASRPLMLYNVPSRTGYTLTLEHYRELAAHPNIVAVKEASGDLMLLEQLCAECGDLLDVYTGNDHQTVTAMKLGARGVISVYSNIDPRAMIELCRLCATGDWRLAAQRRRALLPRMNAIFREVNPIPVKYLVAEQGLCHLEYRLPLAPPSANTVRFLNGLFTE